MSHKFEQLGALHQPLQHLKPFWDQSRCFFCCQKKKATFRQAPFDSSTKTKPLKFKPFRSAWRLHRKTGRKHRLVAAESSRLEPESPKKNSMNLYHIHCFLCSSWAVVRPSRSFHESLGQNWREKDRRKWRTPAADVWTKAINSVILTAVLHVASSSLDTSLTPADEHLKRWKLGQAS